MLVFTRKRREFLVIGDGIVVQILRIGRESIRVGISAPHDVEVHRGELFEDETHPRILAIPVERRARIRAVIRESQKNAPAETDELDS